MGNSGNRVSRNMGNRRKIVKIKFAITMTYTITTVTNLQCNLIDITIT